MNGEILLEQVDFELGEESVVQPRFMVHNVCDAFLLLSLFRKFYGVTSFVESLGVNWGDGLLSSLSLIDIAHYSE